MTDFRVAALLESQKCLTTVSRMVEKKGWDAEPAFWANLLGAVANATIASVPNSVAAGLVAFKERESERSRAAREHVERALQKAKG